MSLTLHLRGLVGSCGRQLGQALLTFVFLPYDAFISLDAIGRTLVRLLFTRKRLLEWQTASDAERTARSGPRGILCDHVDRAGRRSGLWGLSWP